MNPVGGFASACIFMAVTWLIFFFVCKQVYTRCSILNCVESGSYRSLPLVMVGQANRKQRKEGMRPSLAGR